MLYLDTCCSSFASSMLHIKVPDNGNQRIVVADLIRMYHYYYPYH